MPELKEWNSVKETAAYLEVHRDTVMKYIREGLLTSSQVMPNSKHRISRESIEKLLQRGKHEAPSV